MIVSLQRPLYGIVVDGILAWPVYIILNTHPNINTWATQQKPKAQASKLPRAPECHGGKHFKKRFTCDYPAVILHIAVFSVNYAESSKSKGSLLVEWLLSQVLYYYIQLNYCFCHQKNRCKNILIVAVSNNKLLFPTFGGMDSLYLVKGTLAARCPTIRDNFVNQSVNIVEIVAIWTFPWGGGGDQTQLKKKINSWRIFTGRLEMCFQKKQPCPCIMVV